MTDDLAAFIAARLGEDEAAAKAAARKRRGPWRVIGDVFRAIVHGNGGPDMAVADTPGTAIAVHIARHDPGRVLREVAAMRAILTLHRLEAEKALTYQFDPHTGEEIPEQYELTCEVCGWAGDDPTSACPTLRHLAAVWSDHPDYRAGWKP